MQKEFNEINSLKERQDGLQEDERILIRNFLKAKIRPTLNLDPLCNNLYIQKY